ncbi:MAG: FtsQ-type POTRA domain-containing protein [Simkaniaceae bacterium]|nr:FtsQ-type POTRA domain-containing protein [Simkaniaceae bacterium]
MIGKTPFVLIVTIALVTATSYLFVKNQREGVVKRLHDPKRQIRYIVTTGPEKSPLKTAYLAELLQLSTDHPTPFDLFIEKDAEQELQKSPVIKHVEVSKKAPDTIIVDYSIYHPIASLGDFENTAIDEEGHLFPLKPFFSPKNLPEIITGAKTYKTPLESNALALAQSLLTLLTAHNLNPTRIDTSSAFHASLGRREIVLILNTHTLRLFPENPEKQLGNYLSLAPTLPRHTTLDLRLEQCAYLSD